MHPSTSRYLGLRLGFVLAEAHPVVAVLAGLTGLVAAVGRASRQSTDALAPPITLHPYAHNQWQAMIAMQRQAGGALDWAVHRQVARVMACLEVSMDIVADGSTLWRPVDFDLRVQVLTPGYEALAHDQYVEEYKRQMHEKGLNFAQQTRCLRGNS